MQSSNVMISYYDKDIKNINDSKDVYLLQFLDRVRGGEYQDLVLPIRAERNKEKKKKLKEKVPLVTISGVFNKRVDSGLRAHSGFIAIDIDNLGDAVETVKKQLSLDQYVFSCFTSIGGYGLCVLFKIDGTRHREAFKGITIYLYESYNLVVDQSGSNESRARFVSFDPSLYMNDGSLMFKRYPPKEKPRKIPKAVFVGSDFDDIVTQLAPANICENYLEWISIGYALISKFGESGRKYFHALSAPASKYDYETCDRQYDVLLKNEGSKDRTTNISTVYYHAKNNGIDIYSERTKTIIAAASVQRKSGGKLEDIISTLERFEGIPAADSRDIVQQVIDLKIDMGDEDAPIAKLERLLTYNYEFRRNAITKKIELNGVEMVPDDFNSIYVVAKKAFDTDINTEMIDKLINSNMTKTYNPLRDFLESNADPDCAGHIDAYLKCIKVDNPDYFKYFFNKWYVGLISSIYGKHSALMMIYTGPQNNGKTELFRQLLPVEWRANYYAESKLDAGKDDEILMTQKLLIMDDEMGGKSKKESTRLKELTSRDTFSVRPPYGRQNVDIKRLAVLGGTSNEEVGLITDPTGNRRLIINKIHAVDYTAINKADRTLMLVEAHNLFKAGWRPELDKKDIEMLNSGADQFVTYSPEYELINKFYQLPTGTYYHELTATEILIELEAHGGRNLNINKIGQELKRLGYEQFIKKQEGRTKRVYRAEPINRTTQPLH